MNDDQLIALMACVLMAGGLSGAHPHTAVRDASEVLRITREQMRDAAKADMANGLGLRAAS